MLFRTIVFILTFCSYSWAQEFPVSFDLRNVDGEVFCTSVKLQKGGTCWTHGTMAAIESQLLISRTWNQLEEPNLAEYHLDWWNGFNRHLNADFPYTGMELEVHQGGDYYMVTAYSSRGDGPVLESDEEWYDEAPLQYSEEYTDFYINEVLWLVDEDSLETRRRIKEYLMRDGVVAAANCHYPVFYNWDYTFYQPPSDSNPPNHSIAIIGWDDTKKTKAPLPGAWLVKNSFGTDWGEEGYFWISYYDKSCGVHPDMGAVSFTGVIPQPFSNFYYHDYHGWRDTYSESNAGFNAFVANGNGQEDEWLRAVSFITPSDSTHYEVEIFDDFNGDLGTILISDSGFIDHKGYHTIWFEEPILLSEEQDFYVKVTLSQGGMAYDRSSEVPVLLGQNNKVLDPNWIESSAKPGESFVFLDNSWVDFYSIDTTANLCIKAYTAVDKVSSSEENEDFRPSGFVLHQNYPNPFNPTTVISFQLQVTSNVSITIYNSLGQKVRTLFNGRQQMGQHELTWDGKDGLGRAVSSGIYFYILKTDGFSETKKMLLLK